MMETRRGHLGAILATALAFSLAAPPLRATTCDMLRGETVSFIVPVPAGGGYDQVSRLLEPYLEWHSGAEVVINNISGAGGLIAARAIRDSTPDGRTMGILGADWMLLNRIFGDSDTPDLLEEFHLLGQLSTDEQVLLVAANSPIRTIDDVWSTPDGRRPVAGLISVEGQGGTLVLGLARLLDVDLDVVSGYRGSKEVNLALLRGEIDMTPRSVESATPMIRAGEVRAILRFADRPTSGIAEVEGVPVLAGADGVAARRARAIERPADEAMTEAAALVEISRLGRIIAAPGAMPVDVASCLDGLFMAAAGDAGFAADMAKIGRSLALLPGRELTAGLGTVAAAAKRMKPLVAEQVQRVRQ